MCSTIPNQGSTRAIGTIRRSVTATLKRASQRGRAIPPYCYHRSMAGEEVPDEPMTVEEASRAHARGPAGQTDRGFRRMQDLRKISRERSEERRVGKEGSCRWA